MEYDELLAKLRRFRREPLAAGLTSASWTGWRGEFVTEVANEMAKAFAPRLAVLAAAVGAHEGTSEPTPVELIELIQAYLRLRDAVSVPELVADISQRLARGVIGMPLAVLLPDLPTARIATATFSLARVLRAQWTAQFASIDDITRTWWVAKRIDERASTRDATEAVLGMPLPVFVRASQLLLTLAYIAQPNQGRIALTGTIEQALVERYDVSNEVLRLAAFKLSRSPDEFAEWHRTDVDALPIGLKQYVPNALAVTPLIRVDEFVDPAAPRSTHFLCPSLHHFAAAVNNLVRASVAAPRSNFVASIGGYYGEVLEKYVELVLQSRLSAEAVYKIELWENEQQRKADFLARDGTRGLIVEIKRSLGTEFDKHVLDAEGILEVLGMLYSAYTQCETTFDRRPWRDEPACTSIGPMAAIVLVDELAGGEGSALSYLFARTRVPRPPFEVMGISEFEEAVGVLGVARLVDLINEKWRAGYADLPLRLYATKIVGMPREVRVGAKSYLRNADVELLLEIGLARQEYAASWP